MTPMEDKEKAAEAIRAFVEKRKLLQAEIDRKMARLVRWAEYVQRGIDPSQIASVVEPYTPRTMMLAAQGNDTYRETHITKVIMRDGTVHDLSDNPIE